MKKIISGVVCLFAIAALNTPAPAHCGACGVGGDEDIVEACEPGCTKGKGDHEDCPESCTADQDHRPDSEPGAGPGSPDAEQH